jgi:hypothetical protein
MTGPEQVSCVVGRQVVVGNRLTCKKMLQSDLLQRRSILRVSKMTEKR